jgi:hypothetical protein
MTGKGHHISGRPKKMIGMPTAGASPTLGRGQCLGSSGVPIYFLLSCLSSRVFCAVRLQSSSRFPSRRLRVSVPDDAFLVVLPDTDDSLAPLSYPPRPPWPTSAATAPSRALRAVKRTPISPLRRAPPAWRRSRPLVRSSSARTATPNVARTPLRTRPTKARTATVSPLHPHRHRSSATTVAAPRWRTTSTRPSSRTRPVRVIRS